MIDTVTSHNIDLSSRITLYVSPLLQLCIWPVPYVYAVGQVA